MNDTDIDTLAERIAAAIVNGNLSMGRAAITHDPDAALLAVQVVYALSYEMGGDVPAALERVKRLLNV